MKDLVYLKNVVTLYYNEEKCTDCGMCLEVCPHAVFSRNGKRVFLKNRDACMECGACSRNCPAEAITVQSGVGCAAAFINAMIGRTDSPCCAGETCTIPTGRKDQACC